jgi:hypothetical protein
MIRVLPVSKMFLSPLKRVLLEARPSLMVLFTEASYNNLTLITNHIKLTSIYDVKFKFKIGSIANS